MTEFTVENRDGEDKLCYKGKIIAQLNPGHIHFSTYLLKRSGFKGILIVSRILHFPPHLLVYSDGQALLPTGKTRHCLQCDVELTNENWEKCYRKKGWYICDDCRLERGDKWREEHRLSYLHTTSMGTIYVDKTEPKGQCELCGKLTTKLVWHHWDDSNSSLGFWACHRCNIRVELYDQHLIDRYLSLKEQVRKRVNNLLSSITPNLSASKS